MGSDFTVESKGHCFICLNKTNLLQQKPFVKDDGEAYVSKSQIYSLQSLSRCLKMDMGKVFNQTEPIPQTLLDQVQQSKLTAELCEGCALLNNKVSELCRRLEKIEMELASSLTLIHEKLVESEKTVQGGDYLMNTGSSDDNSSHDWKGKLAVLQTLRKEAIQKCSRKSGSRLPLITVKNLTMKEITKEKLKSKGCSPTDANSPKLYEHEDGLSRLQIDVTNVKQEIAHSPPVDDDDNAGYYDNSDMNPETDDFSKDEVSQDYKIEAGGGNRTSAEISQSMSAESSQQDQERRYIYNPKTGKYKCTVCSREFPQHSSAIRHYRNIHLKVKYKCSLCKKEFTGLTSYKIHHQGVHLGIIRFKSCCNNTFYDKSTLRKHQKLASCRLEGCKL